MANALKRFFLTLLTVIPLMACSDSEPNLNSTETGSNFGNENRVALVTDISPYSLTMNLGPGDRVALMTATDSTILGPTVVLTANPMELQGGWWIDRIYVNSAMGLEGNRCLVVYDYHSKNQINGSEWIVSGRPGKPSPPFYDPPLYSWRGKEDDRRFVSRLYAFGEVLEVYGTGGGYQDWMGPGSILLTTVPGNESTKIQATLHGSPNSSDFYDEDAATSGCLKFPNGRIGDFLDGAISFGPSYGRPNYTEVIAFYDPFMVVEKNGRPFLVVSPDRYGAYNEGDIYAERARANIEEGLESLGYDPERLTEKDWELYCTPVDKTVAYALPGNLR